MNTFILFSFISSIIFSFTSELTSASGGGRPLTRTDEEVAALYEEWLIKHGKINNNNNNHNLLGEKPRSKRFEIFKDNLNYIDHHNSISNQTYKLGLTCFADLTNQEFRSMYLDTGIGAKLRKLSSSESYSDRYLPKPGDHLPDSVDWREKGAVTPVKDQGGCGACWAFTAVSTIEAINKMVTGDLISLSVQELVDCDTKSTNKGCEGGLMNPAYDFIIKNGGIDSEEDYPYKGRDGTCDPYREKANVVTIDGYENVPANNEEALKKAVTNQVVGVALSLGGIGFQLYQSGIYTGKCGNGSKFDHGVSIVGYGSEDGLDYWILKNSWSTNWGDNGYMKLQRNVADPQGLCAIAAYPSYPLKTGPNPPNPGPSPPTINPPTVCDHFSECQAGSTCCCISSDYFLGNCLTWGCCPMENAVCCEEDPTSCCPHNYPICNPAAGTCSMRKNNPFGIRMMKHTLATPIIKTVSSSNEGKKSSF